MSRHRNIRRMNYDEECEGFDDVYGRSVEDDPYCVSPSTASQFMYDRNAGQHAIAAFFPSDNIPEEEDETDQSGLPLAKDSERQNSLDNQFPDLNAFDQARLTSCLDEIRNIVGDMVPEKKLIDSVVSNDFDLERALHSILDTATTSDNHEQRRDQPTKQKSDYSSSSVITGSLKGSLGGGGKKRAQISIGLVRSHPTPKSSENVSLEQLSKRHLNCATNPNQPECRKAFSLLQPSRLSNVCRPVNSTADGQVGPSLTKLAQTHSGQPSSSTSFRTNSQNTTPLSLLAQRHLDQTKGQLASGSENRPVFGLKNAVQTEETRNDERDECYVPDLSAALRRGPKIKPEIDGHRTKAQSVEAINSKTRSEGALLTTTTTRGIVVLTVKRRRSARHLTAKPSLFARVLCLRLRHVHIATPQSSRPTTPVAIGSRSNVKRAALPVIPFEFSVPSPDAVVLKTQSQAFGPQRSKRMLQSDDLRAKRSLNIEREDPEVVSAREEITRLTINSDFSGLVASEKEPNNAKDGRSRSPKASSEKMDETPSSEVTAALTKPNPKMTRDAAFVKAVADAAEAEYAKVRGDSKQLLNMVVIGHVDAGKSTLMGHLLWLLGAVNKKQMHKFEQESKKIGKSSFMYAWVLDETGEERSRGVTMDVGYSRFETSSKVVTLLDAPGHKDFIPNMIMGAAQADVATLVVDSTRGEFETGFESGGQTREHALLVRSLGVSQLLVAVNKLDTVGWSQERYADIVQKLGQFLKQAGFKESDIIYVPCSGLTGENLIAPSVEEGLAKWYSGPTLLEQIDAFRAPTRPVTMPFRLSVSDVFKGQGSTFSVSGKVETGVARVGDRVSVMPVGESATIKGIVPIVLGGELEEDAPPHSGGASAFAGDQVILSLSNVDMASVSVGSVLCDPARPIRVATRFIARIVVFNIEFLITKGFQAVLHYQSLCEPIIVKKLISQLHKSTGEAIKKKPRCLTKQSNAVVELETCRPICIEVYKDIKEMGRFMLRSAGTTVAAGLVTEIL